MTRHDQIYALFVEANPYPDVESLPETFQEARVPLRAVDASGEIEFDERRESLDASAELGTRPRRRGRLVVVVAAVVVAVGLSLLLARSLDTTAPPVSGETGLGLTHIEQAVEFISRLEAQDVNAAQAMLADPMGTIFFVPIGQVSGTEQVRNYLEFYVAMGIETYISACVGQSVGPLTEVVCEATQTTGALSQLGLELPAFEMTFGVGDAGIQQIGWQLEGPQQFSVAFTQSRFFEFRDSVLRPLGLVRGNDDPVWSKENGELTANLIDEFISENS